MAIRDEVQRCREAARELERLRKQGKFPGVISVGIGYKYKNGKRTEEVAVIVGVREKKPIAELAPEEVIPPTIDGVPTDVIEDEGYEAYEVSDLPKLPPVTAEALVERRRPCPGGFSCGHGQITAGTLGAWLRRGENDGTYVILSNNHVLAASNAASPGDFIRQPGRADGGTDVDRIARLEEFVSIRFGSNGGGGNGGNGGKKNRGLARLWWKTWMGVANLPASFMNCPVRLRADRQALEQPWPNLVDAAVARQFGGDVVDRTVWEIGEPLGFRDLQLGDIVEKTGRTTEHTVGMVERVEVSSSVSYGAAGTAEFQDQFVIRATDGGDFSAGGDSGSVILVDGMIGGLLFAGGGGVTIANRISHVISLLGIRL